MMTEFRLKLMNKNQQYVEIYSHVILKSVDLDQRIKTTVSDGLIKMNLGEGNYNLEVYPEKKYENYFTDFYMPENPENDTFILMVILNQKFQGEIEEIEYPPEKYSMLKDIKIGTVPEKKIVLKQSDGELEVIADYATQMDANISTDLLNLEGMSKYVDGIKRNPDEFTIDVVLGDVYKDGKVIRHRDSELAKLKEMVKKKSLIDITSNITYTCGKSKSKLKDKYLMITSVSITQNESENTYDASIDLKSVSFAKSQYKITASIGDTGIPWGNPDDGSIVDIPKSEIEIEEEDDKTWARWIMEGIFGSPDY